MHPAEQKAALRSRLRAARRERGAIERGELSREVCLRLVAEVAEVDEGRSLLVTGYLATPGEPDIDEALDQLSQRGHRVLVPRIRGRELDWVAWERGTEVAAGPLGIREPTATAVPREVLRDASVLLVPGLAVDRTGHRLGQGGGYYDRVLTELPGHAEGGPLRVVVLFDDEVLSDVPHEEYDQRVDVAVTPARTLSLG